MAQGMPPIPILHHTVDQGPSSFMWCWWLYWVILKIGQPNMLNI
jgi:hypothetical protein